MATWLRWLVWLVVAVAGLAPTGAGPSGGGGEDVRPVLLSRRLAEAESLNVGDLVRLSGDPSGDGSRSFRVVGVYEPTPDPMNLTENRYEARLHLPDLHDLIEDGPQPRTHDSLDAVNVLLHDAEDARRFARDLETRMPGLDVVPAAGADQGASAFVVLERFHLAIALVTVVGSTAFLLALMVMRAEERRETVGILRLIGFSKPRVLLEVFIEGTAIAVVGAVFGVLLAAATQDLFNRFFQWHYDTRLVFVRVTPGIAWRCIALAVPLGVAAGLLASWNLLRREILALLRR